MKINSADYFCMPVIQRSVLDMKLKASSVSATIFTDENVIWTVQLSNENNISTLLQPLEEASKGEVGTKTRAR